MIHKLDLTIANAYLIEGKYPILVDTGGPKSFDTLQKSLKRVGFDLQDIALILHTHGHGDHVGSTAQLKQRYNISTALHTADWEMVKQGRNKPFKFTRFGSRLIAPFVNTPFKAFQPDRLLDSTFPLQDYGIDAQIIHTPGHTRGSISIVCGSGEAVVGDVLMGGHLGGAFQPGLPRYHYFYDDLTQIHQSIKLLLDRGVQTFYVGHGGPLAREAVIQKFGNIVSAVANQQHSVSV